MLAPSTGSLRRFWPESNPRHLCKIITLSWNKGSWKAPVTYRVSMWRVRYKTEHFTCVSWYSQRPRDEVCDIGERERDERKTWHLGKINTRRRTPVHNPVPPPARRAGSTPKIFICYMMHENTLSCFRTVRNLWPSQHRCNVTPQLPSISVPEQILWIFINASSFFPFCRRLLTRDLSL